MGFVVAGRRCTRRNATGCRDTDEHRCFERVARRNHKRNAMAVRAEAVEENTVLKVKFNPSTAASLLERGQRNNMDAYLPDERQISVVFCSFRESK